MYNDFGVLNFEFLSEALCCFLFAKLFFYSFLTYLCFEKHLIIIRENIHSKSSMLLCFTILLSGRRADMISVRIFVLISFMPIKFHVSDIVNLCEIYL